METPIDIIKREKKVLEAEISKLIEDFQKVTGIMELDIHVYFDSAKETNDPEVSVLLDIDAINEGISQ